jgi:integrase
VPHGRVRTGRQPLPHPAFTGLRRGELVAPRRRDVDFPASRIRDSASYAGGGLTAPKSSKVRSARPRPEKHIIRSRSDRRHSYRTGRDH